MSINFSAFGQSSPEFKGQDEFMQWLSRPLNRDIPVSFEEHSDVVLLISSKRQFSVYIFELQYPSNA